MNKFFLAGLFLIISCPSLVWGQQNITMTTYYPAPSGNYDQMRLVPRAPAAMVCNAANQGNLFVRNDTGIIQYCNNNLWAPIGGAWSEDTITNSIYPTDTA